MAWSEWTLLSVHVVDWGEGEGGTRKLVTSYLPWLSVCWTVTGSDVKQAAPGVCDVSLKWGGERGGAYQLCEHHSESLRWRWRARAREREIGGGGGEVERNSIVSLSPETKPYT